MSKVTEANFELHSVKMLKTGIKASVTETHVLGNDVTSKDTVNYHCKDDAHPDFVKAFEKLQEIVRYDEGLGETADITVTGLALHGSNVAQITHLIQFLSCA